MNDREASERPPAIEIRHLQKNYHGVRPLRIQALTVQADERVAIAGLDQAAAELLVNLITGAALPDEGDVMVFGESTASIRTGPEWLASLERFGIVSHRAVLLESSTIAQNLAMPFTLELDPIPADAAAKAAALATEVALNPSTQVVGALGAESRMRVHLARAIALEPAIVLIEHPTMNLSAAEVGSFARDVRRVLKGRRLPALVLTADRRFSKVVADRTLTLRAATGELTSTWRWF